MVARRHLRPVAVEVAVVLAVFGLLGSSACGDDDTEPGIANPASVFCEQQGGRVEIERDRDGNERGMCVLPDGSRVDEWEHYRQHHEDAGG